MDRKQTLSWKRLFDLSEMLVKWLQKKSVGMWCSAAVYVSF